MVKFLLQDPQNPQAAAFSPVGLPEVMLVTSIVQVFQVLKYRMAGRNEPVKREETITQLL